MSHEPIRTFDEKARAGLGDLKDRVSNITAEVKDKASKMADTVSETVGQARESAAGGLDKAASTTHNLADGMKSTASYLKDHDLSQMGNDAMSFCRRYPTQSLIAAIAVGFLIGRARR